MFSHFSGNYTASSYVYSLVLEPYGIIITMAAVIFSIPTAPKLKELFIGKGHAAAGEYIASAVSLVLFAMCIMSLMTASYNPFIYFRF
jgi:alginate O-acetyltransferase complex protein AlgI